MIRQVLPRGHGNGNRELIFWDKEAHKFNLLDFLNCGGPLNEALSQGSFLFVCSS